MTSENQAKKEVNIPTMIAENMGASLKSFILQEMRVMPNVWEKMNQTQQNESVERIERKIRYMSAAAANTMASGGQVSVSGHVESINLKDKIKLTMIVSHANSQDNLSELYSNSKNQECRLVLCDSDQYTEGMDLVEIPEPDQQTLVDEDDELLWCVVVPIRSGQTIVPAPSHAQAEGFALKTRKLLMLHDTDLACNVYAKPWDANKANHATLLKKGHWRDLQEWYKKIEAGGLKGDDLKAEIVALIEHVPSNKDAPKSSDNEDKATKVAQDIKEAPSDNKKPSSESKKDTDAEAVSNEDKPAAPKPAKKPPALKPKQQSGK